MDSLNRKIVKPRITSSRATSQRAVWLFIIISCLLIISIGLLGYTLHQRIKNRIYETVTSELNSIADLKTQQLFRWRKERIADITTLRDNPMLSDAIRDLIRDPDNFLIRSEIQVILHSFINNYHYEKIWITDYEGRTILSTDSSLKTSNPHIQFSRKVIRTQEIRFLDFHRDLEGEEVHLTLASPVEIIKNGIKVPIGSLNFGIDPDDFLYPYIQLWPTPTKTAETLIVRKEEENIIFLNRLRHLDSAILEYYLPLIKEDLPAAMAISGKSGIVEGKDYRDVEVMAAIRHIPGSFWYLVSKIDKREIEEPIRAQTMPIALLTGSLLLMSILGIIMVNRWQVAQYYREQYESELEKEALNRHYEYLTKYANDIILLFDKDSRIIEANDRALEAYQYDIDELVHMTASDLRAVPDSYRIAEMGSETGTVIETVHRRKDGSIFTVEVSSRYIEINGTKFIQSIIRDITRRKTIEQELRKSEERLRSLLDDVFDSALIGTFILDKNFDVVWINKHIEKYFGINREDVIGKNKKELIHNQIQYIFEDPEFFKKKVLATYHNNTYIENFECVVNADNIRERRVLEHWSQPIKSGYYKGGRVEYYTNITDRVKNEEEIKQLNNHLEKRVDEKTTELQAIIKELESFAYTVSHDLRAPLRHMSGYVSFLEEDYSKSLDKTGQYYIKKIIDSSHFMGELIDALLQFSRFGRKEIEKKYVNLNKIVSNSIETLSTEINGREIRWKIGKLPVIGADEKLISQVFINLISNAIKYSSLKNPAEIEIGTDKKNSQYIVYIKDNGVGFDMQYQDKLFGVFQRLHVNEFEGIGIGLANVQRIIHRHGGKVWAEGKVNEGATFYIQIPEN